MRVSKLSASQQLVGAVTPAFDQPRAHALPPLCTAVATCLPCAGVWESADVSCTLREITNLPYQPCPIAHADIHTC